MEFNLPTCLTLLRIVLIPVLVITFYLPWEYAHVLCAAIFALAGATDWLDGYLARSLGQTTLFGAFLDPVADKLIVVFSLVLIVQAIPSPWVSIPAAVIIGREITIASLREWMAEIGARKAVEVSWMGKWKTTAQITAIIALMLAIDVPIALFVYIGYGVLYVAAALTIWSMVNYLVAAWPNMKKP